MTSTANTTEGPSSQSRRTEASSTAAETCAAGPVAKRKRTRQKSPTQRSLDEMRKRGYLADVVERWIPRMNVRKDLFGIGDVLCVGEREVVMVQSTSGSNVSSRVNKIAAHENIAAVRRSGIRILVHGWTRVNGRWHLREVDCS